MTLNDLVNKFNTEFKLGQWPSAYRVDHETYANVCQELFNTIPSERLGFLSRVTITLGPNKGILLKNVELILK